MTYIARTAWTFEVEGTDLLLWSGFQPMTFSGKTYMGCSDEDGNCLVSVSEVEQSLDQPNRRMTVALAMTDPAVRARFMQDFGPLPVRIQWLLGGWQGTGFRSTGFSFHGFMSKPKLLDGLYTVEIETYLGDVDRGEPVKWSHESQQVRHPGDIGFNSMRQLASGLEIKWPT